MGKGKRYNNEERQLNIKKVIGLFVVIAIIILFVVGIKKIIKADKQVMARKNIELAYFPAFSNGNWGIIDSSGNTIIEPAYAEMIMVPNKNKPVFITTNNSNYADGTYTTKAINSQNQEIFTEYQNVIPLQNYDSKNNLWYEDNVLKVQKEGKYGLINLDGNILLNCEYDSISVIKGIKNSLLIKKDGKTGLINTSGKIIVPVNYAEVQALTEFYYNGYIVKNVEGKYGIIDAEGNTVLECTYDGIKNTTDSGMYIVNSNGNWKVILKDGTSYLEGKVNNATSINAGNVIVNNDGKYGVLNIEKDVQIPIQYQGLKYTFGTNYIAKKNGKYGIINVNNDVLIDFKYSSIEYNTELNYFKAKKSEGVYEYINKDFQVKITAGNEEILSNGYIKIVNKNEIKYYNNKLEEKNNKDVYASNTVFIIKENGKYGFIDKNGNKVVECKYEDATEQNDYGFSGIKLNGKWGVIDQYGNIVLEAKYTIPNSLNKDFIGKWHSSADTNANYFTDID